MLRAPIFALPLFALAACGGGGLGDSGVDLTNATMAEVAAEAQKVQPQQPGQWEVTTEITNFEIDGLEDDSPLAAMMQQQVGQKNTDSHCLTEEDAKKAMLPQDIDPNNSCRFDHFRMKGGQIDAQMRCDAPDGAGTVEMTQKGSYSSDSYDVTSTMKRAGGQGPGANSTMSMNISSKRTGECTV